MPISAYASTPSLDDLANNAPPTPAAAAPLGFFDKVKLGFQSAGAGADWGWNQHNYEVSAYHDIRSALEAKGYKLPDTPLLSSGDEADFYAVGYHPGKSWLAGPKAQQRFNAFWNAFNDARTKDANFAATYKDVHDFGTLLDHVKGQRNAVLTDVSTKAPDGLGLAGIVGGFGRAPLDPISWIPLAGPEVGQGLNFGARLLAQGLKAAAINAGVTTAVEPFVRRDAARLGVQRTAGDFVTDLLTSSAFGTVVGAGHEAVRLAPSIAREGSLSGGVRRFEADQFGKALNRAVDRADLPAGSPFRSFDATVARAFSEAVPPEQRTPDEQAAVQAVNRDAEIKSSSPFVPGPAGDDAHAGWLEQAMAVLHNAAPPLQSVKPVERESVATPDDVAASRAPARELVKAKIHSAEGDGPNKLGGSALGPYQFEPRTWVDLFKRRYPNDQRSFDQVAALRTDPHLNDVLINDLIAENAMRLRHAGLDESAGNLYLAHVLGADRAIAVLHAGPEARLSDILPHNYFDRNPFRPTDSAASLIHWAYGKMGDKGVPIHVATADAAAGAEAISAGEGDPEVQPSTGRYEVAAMYSDIGMDDRPVLRPELFDSPEEHAAAQLRFERQRDMADGFAPIMSRAEAFSPGDHFGALRGYTGKVTTEAIGEALGLSPEEVRRSVQSMMAIDRNSPFVLARERGTPADAPATRVMRRPKPPQSSKPETLIQFIKRIGGLDAASAGDIVHIAGGVDQVGKLADVRLHAAREALRNARYSKAPPALRDHQISTAKERLDAAERAVQSDPRGVGLDTAMEAAVEAGFFPEMGFDAYSTKPDNSALLDAIDAELRGQTPRTRITDAQTIAEAEAEAQRERYGDQPDEAPVDRAERLFELTGHNHEAISDAAGRRGVVLTDDDMVLTASDLIDQGMSPDEALDSAIIDASVRDLEEFAAATGEKEYGPSHDAATYVGDHAEDRGGDGAGGEIGPGGGRSTADAAAASAGGERFAQLAHDPAAGEFGNPVGAAAEAQADSTIHDLQMAASDGSIRAALDRKDRLALRQRWFDEQRAALGLGKGTERLRAAELADKEPWLDPDFLLKTYADDPEAGAAVLEALTEQEALKGVEYRLDEEGGASDLDSILDEIEQAQKDAATMRDCIKPNGGAE